MDFAPEKSSIWLVSAVLALSCAESDGKPSGGAAASKAPTVARKPLCFDVVASTNSSSTQAVFRAKKCQGGGVTWSGLLGVLVDRRGDSQSAGADTAGWTGDVRELTWKNSSVRVGIDDEADAARFCTDSQALLDAIQSDVRELNVDAAKLEGAMAQAHPLASECAPDAATMAALMRNLDPVPPISPAETQFRAASLARLRDVLAKERTWCWRKSGVSFGGMGGLTLHADGKATAFGNSNAPQSGKWTFEDDGRVQVLAGGLHHFDVGKSGHLGFDHTGGREELDPCEAAESKTPTATSASGKSDSLLSR